MNKHRASIGLLSINNFCLNLGRQAHVQAGTKSKDEGSRSFDHHLVDQLLIYSNDRKSEDRVPGTWAWRPRFRQKLLIDKRPIDALCLFLV